MCAFIVSDTDTEGAFCQRIVYVTVFQRIIYVTESSREFPPAGAHPSAIRMHAFRLSCSLQTPLSPSLIIMHDVQDIDLASIVAINEQRRDNFLPMTIYILQYKL